MSDLPQSEASLAALMRSGLASHVAGRLEEAETAYRAILAQRPNHADALGMLALIVTDGRDDAEAEAVVLRHLALRPDAANSLLCLGRLRSRQGDDTQAVAIFRRAAQRSPDFAPIHNELGVSLLQLGHREEALDAFSHAVRLNPQFDAARANRGMVLFDCGRFDEAVDDFLAALTAPSPSAVNTGVATLTRLRKAANKVGRLAEAEAAVRAYVEAGHDGAVTLEELAVILDLLKRPDEARQIRNNVARRAGVQRSGGGGDAKETVIVLGAVGAGHVPTRYLLDPQVFEILSFELLSPDQPDAPMGAVEMRSLAGAGVIFSTLADAHRDSGQLAAAKAFCAAAHKPVLNPPDAIPRTARDRAVALFADIPGMVTPWVRPITPEDLARVPIRAPLLVRPAGDHGGENLIKLESETDKRAYLEAGPGPQLLLSPFHDFRSPDGYWRKYRLIFVDRQVYPFHLAIGEDWLLHYWRAEMAHSAWKLAEEDRFLTDWRGVFGPVAAAAVEEAARRLDLDYGGMDCALGADGRLLLFEANATILLHLDEPATEAPAKHRHVPQIREAFTRLVLQRAAQ